MTGVRILIADDEPQIRRLLKAALARGGYETIEAEDGRAALSALDIDKPDLVLLDLGFPDRDGIELIGAIKARSPAKILVVTAREDVREKVAALDLGADDYVTKPFDTDELLARVRALLRQRPTAEAERQIVRAGALEIDLGSRLVRRGGAEVHLTPKEYGVLAELAKNPGRVITHRHLLATVWGPAQADRSEYLRVVMRGLREKLEEHRDKPALLTNEPGVGYRLRLLPPG